MRWSAFTLQDSVYITLCFLLLADVCSSILTRVAVLLSRTQLATSPEHVSDSAPQSAPSGTVVRGAVVLEQDPLTSVSGAYSRKSSSHVEPMLHLVTVDAKADFDASTSPTWSPRKNGNECCGTFLRRIARFILCFWRDKSDKVPVYTGPGCVQGQCTLVLCKTGPSTNNG